MVPSPYNYPRIYSVGLFIAQFPVLKISHQRLHNYFALECTYLLPRQSSCLAFCTQSPLSQQTTAALKSDFFCDTRLACCQGRVIFYDDIQDFWPCHIQVKGHICFDTLFIGYRFDSISTNKLVKISFCKIPICKS